ncbi:MAG: site-specific integrase [Desulfobacca sp.]|nr:site-specific integrase [Desulfobacca sp.]
MATIRKKTGSRGVTWQADWYDPEGRRVRKNFDRRRDAEAFVGKVTVSKKEGRYHDVFDIKPETRVTFSDLADRYVENFQNQKSFKDFKAHVIKDLRAIFGDRRLSEITYLDLETYRNKRKATTTKNGGPRKDSSVNRDMAILGHMLSKAVEWGLLESSPFKKGKRLMFKENNHRLRFLTEAEIDRLLAECPKHLKPIVETALLTGMRRGELLSLKWEQVRNGFIYLTETKSNKSRQIPINDRLARLFKELRTETQLRTEHVFVGPDGKRLHEVKRSFAGACRRAGIEDFHFHDLRHTFASHLVMAGVSLKAVQELLGHADIKMTMRYSHLSQAHLKDAVAALNGLGNGHEWSQIQPETKRAANLSINNLSESLPFSGRDERI